MNCKKILIYKIFAMSLPISMTLCTNECSAGERPAKPNIIFLLTDDQRDNTFGAMGHPYIQTPNTDKLINEGVRFSNTYIASPVCAPSRVSFFTGLPERVHGVGFSSAYQLTEEQWSKTYPAILRENGYFTGFIGKFGVEYYTFKGKADSKFDFWYGHDGWTRFFPKDYHTVSCIPYHGAKNNIITEIMGESIDNFLDSVPSHQPFCLSVSFNVPHGSQTTSMHTDYEEWFSMARPANENPKLKGHAVFDTLYRNRKILIPAETSTDPYLYIPRHIMDQEKGRIKTYEYDYTIESTIEHHIRYYQTITGVDHVIGELMQSLKNRGLDDNTIVIFASDHGLLMGEYGMGGKELLYDLTSKIPCFIYDPRLPEPQRGKTINALVSSLDLPVTILDYAGINAPEPMPGMSLVPLINDESFRWRDELFLECLFTLRDNPFSEGIRTGNWKYIRMYKGVVRFTEKDLDFTGRDAEFEQLFNLADDPGEKINLVHSGEYSQTLQLLRGKVADYSRQLNDTRAKYLSLTDCITKNN
jgi:arylsulfatase A-like enzyme